MKARLQKRQVLMVGPALHERGGMSAVAKSYFDAGLDKHIELRFVSSYEAGTWLHRQRLFGAALLQVLSALLAGRVAGMHLHSAARGSFWRKSLLAALARLFGVSYVFHIHSGEFLQFHEQCGGIARRWVRHCLSHASEVLLLTPSWKTAFEARFAGIRFAVLPNPVDVPAAVPVRTCTRPTLLFLGRIRAKKGMYELLEAMPRVLSVVPDACLVMAGDGELDAARQRAVALGVASAVVLPGWLDGIRKQQALAGCDVFVLPSHFEGLPIGLLEAMASGRLVVASRVGGVPDLIRGGENGLLVEAGDVQQLSEALVRALVDEEGRQAMQAQARRDVMPFAADAVLGELLRCYRRVWGDDGLGLSGERG